MSLSESCDLFAANDGIPELTIKNERLIETIHETADLFGAKYSWGPLATDTGVCRLALSDEDKGMRDWFVKEAEKAGCGIAIDDMGNIFAIYPGRKNGLPTAIGSHLDTQPTGGRYDGIYGVLSGLEVVRTLKDNDYVPEYPIAVVSWTNEEGARFPMSMMASTVWANPAKKDEIYNLTSVTDTKPVTVKHELERIGYLGPFKCSFEGMGLAAHFELHIEQGPILETEKKEIGRVQGIQALKWIEVSIKGKAQHTGTTPFASRSDALLAASKFMVKGNEIAALHDGLFSVGILEVLPGVVNVVPQEVKFVMDIRHHCDEELDDMYLETLKAFQEIAQLSGKKLCFEVKHLVNQKAVFFDEACMDCIKRSADQVVGIDQSIPIVSGAGHDSGLVAARCPTAMIFIPSRDGVSHNPEEYSTPQQVQNGFKVLLGAVLRYDKLRSK
ncbi:hypothetical protein PUMCH_002100 [Australozyma saopauloensis]|uniref:Uncharacterized protein n=1 Tax=Australozyma saopauloensis TaxID=291208 RepID=A0AAX4H8R7_9ASCO|nr:hypothetical protein PUMCH_002100 [[Candida] saopauloensis]